MRSFILFVLLCLLAIFGGVIVCCARTLPENRPRIGFVLPLSGPRASLARDAADAARLAVETLEQQRRIAPELLFEDSEGLPAKGVSAFQKLVQGGVKVIVTQHSNVSLAAAPLANRERIVQIGTMTTSDAYSTPDDFTFRVNGTVRGEAEAMAAHLAASGRSSTLAVVSAEDEYPEALKRNLSAELSKAGIFPVYEETVLPHEQDLRTVVTQARSKGATSIVFLGYAVQSGALLKQIRQQQWKPDLVLLCTPANTDEFFTAAGAAAEGARVTSLETAKNSEAAKLYLSSYGRDLSVPAANAFDSVMLAERAYEKCGFAEDSECLRRGLAEIRDFEGISGQHGFSDKNGDMIDRYQVQEAHAGRFEPLVKAVEERTAPERR